MDRADDDDIYIYNGKVVLMKKLLILPLTAILIIGLAVAFGTNFSTIISDNTSASIDTISMNNHETNMGDDSKIVKTLQNNPHTWNLTDPSEFRSDNTSTPTPEIMTITSALHTSTDPYVIREAAPLVVVGTITMIDQLNFLDPTVAPVRIHYAKYFLDIDEVISGSYEKNTIEVVIIFNPSRLVYEKGDQVFLMLEKTKEVNNNYGIDAWWPLAQDYGMYKVNGDKLIGKSVTIIKDELY